MSIVVEIKIEHQGSPMINEGYICSAGKDVMAIEIDMRSKYCSVTGFHGGEKGPGIAIEATEDSTNLNEGVDREMETNITFPGFAGWSVWSANILRYSLRVCLVRDSE